MCVPNFIDNEKRFSIRPDTDKRNYKLSKRGGRVFDLNFQNLWHRYTLWSLTKQKCTTIRFNRRKCASMSYWDGKNVARLIRSSPCTGYRILFRESGSTENVSVCMRGEGRGYQTVSFVLPDKKMGLWKWHRSRQRERKNEAQSGNAPGHPLWEPPTLLRSL